MILGIDRDRSPTCDEWSMPISSGPNGMEHVALKKGHLL